MDSYRTFVAIELPHALRAKLIEHIQQLRREAPDARASWSRENNLHLTLKFLGNIPVSEIRKLSSAVARAVTAVRPFELTVAGCGVFPPKGRPNVLWIGVEDTSAGMLADDRGHLARASLSEGDDSRHSALSVIPSPLATLQSAIEDECSKAGFAHEQRPFHPHLTIARLRKHGDERRLAEAHQKLGFNNETFSVSEVVVFKSELLPQGSKHTPISRHPLQISTWEK